MSSDNEFKILLNPIGNRRAQVRVSSAMTTNSRSCWDASAI
jgi:hypothetical protein